MNLNGTWAWTGEDKEIFIPDTRIPPKQENTYIPLKGHGYVMAVSVNGRVVGYVTAKDLGYDNVKEWMEENK